MTTAIRRRRGTTAQHSSFTGAAGETTIDTDKEVVVVHDGVQVGGYPLMRENGSNSALALGSAGTPSLKFTGDTNTGIYSPGADQVAISTNGSQRIAINSAGRVVLSDSEGIQLSAKVSGLYTVDGSLSYYAANNGVYLNGAGANGYLQLQAAGTENYRTAINLFGSTGTPADTITFRTANSERMRLDSSGRLGLGTSAPQTLLQAAGAIESRSSNTYRGIRLEAQDSSFQVLKAHNYLGAGYNSQIQFQTMDGTSVTTAATIDQLGRLGLGTSSPSFTAHISGTKNTSQLFIDAPTISAANDYAQIGFGIGGTAFGLVRLAFDNPAGVSNSYLSFYNNNGSSNVERMRIDSSGRVGIGTSSPERPLHVIGTGRFDNGAIDSVYTGTTTGAQLGIFRTYGVGAGVTGEVDLIGRLESGSLSNSYFSINTTFSGVIGERLRVDSSGRVGIGTTSPGSALDVVGNARVSGAYSWSDYANTIYHGITAPAADVIAFRGGGSERARIDSSGRLLVGTSSSILSYANLQVTGGSDNAGHVCLANGGTAPVNGANIGSIRFTNSAGGIGAQFNCEADGAWTAGSNYRSRLTFSTTADGASSPTERMRISEAGHILGGGMTSLTAGSSVKGFNFENQGNNGRLNLHANSSAGTASGINFYHSGSQVGGITYSSTATAYNTSSDYRLKENVVPLTGAADRLNQLQVHRFNFLADPDKIVDGFLAHEAQAVVPECVTGTKDEVDADGNPVYQGIDQSKLVPLLTAALQEAIAKIETLEAKVAALEAA